MMCSKCSREKCTKNFISYFNAIARQTMYIFLKTYMGKKIFLLLNIKKVTTDMCKSFFLYLILFQIKSWRLKNLADFCTENYYKSLNFFPTQLCNKRNTNSRSVIQSPEIFYILKKYWRLLIYKLLIMCTRSEFNCNSACFIVI